MPSRFRTFRGPLLAGPPALLAALVALAALGAAPASAAAPRVGDRAPAFDLKPLVAGRPGASLASLSGEVVLLDFWASWCAPCKLTLPGLARLQKRHRGLRVLAVSLDEDRGKALAFLKGQDTSLAALHDAGRKVAESYDLGGMPAAVLIDRKGVLRARYDGYVEDDLEAMEADARKLMEEKP